MAVVTGGVINCAKQRHKFCTMFRGVFSDRRWIKASSRYRVTEYNCDPANDPSENKLPSSIYGLLGLAGAREQSNLRAREHLFCKLGYETPRRREREATLSLFAM